MSKEFKKIVTELIAKYGYKYIDQKCLYCGCTKLIIHDGNMEDHACTNCDEELIIDYYELLKGDK